MEYQAGETIKRLRKRLGVSQESLAAALGVSMQAVSKWETGKANPDLFLMPKLAEYFRVDIGVFFYGLPEPELPEEAEHLLEKNRSGWTGVLDTAWKGVTALPYYGPFTPTEEELCLFGDVRGKAVLELACGTGESLLWMGTRGAGELWGLDISAARIARARDLLEAYGQKAELFVSPMERDPGLPARHFDAVFSIYGLGWSMDLEQTASLIAGYLKPGGVFVFSWDNPLMQCVDAAEGAYRLSRSYVAEREVEISKEGNALTLRNWKLSTYLNCLADHGFYLEKVVEESVFDPAEADVFLEGKYYSAGKARLIHPTVIVKARKWRE